ARLALQLARAAMHWARLDSSPLAEADLWAEAATRAFASTAGSTQEHGESLIAHARVKLRAQDAVRAGELATSALDLVHDAPGTAPAEAHLVLATVALALNADAARHLGEARQLLDTLNHPVFGSDRQAAHCWRELGDLYGKSGDKAQQTRAYRKALEAAGVHSALAGVKIDASVSH
ncbi:MAG TPA: transcriptional regulator, partial [Nonomuraea sp.]|nr:transcriptional regulator [Nonomuraea sp.]